MASRSILPFSRNMPASRSGEDADPILMMRRELNRLYDDAFGGLGLPSFFRPGPGQRPRQMPAPPKINVSETDAGYDPVYGARPLKRVIPRELQNPLTVKILSGEIRDGDTVRVTASPLGLLLQPAARRGEEPEAARHAAQ